MMMMMIMMITIIIIIIVWIAQSGEGLATDWNVRVRFPEW
jgi:hypothetical protein